MKLRQKLNHQQIHNNADEPQVKDYSWEAKKRPLTSPVVWWCGPAQCPVEGCPGGFPDPEQKGKSPVSTYTDIHFSPTVNIPISTKWPAEFFLNK